MLCTPVNAYPHGHCVSADSPGNKLKFTFNGDAAKNVYFWLGNVRPPTFPVIFHKAENAANGGFFNGEEVSCPIPNNGTIKNDGEYMWRSIIVQDIDTENHRFPSTKIASGFLRMLPYMKAVVSETSYLTHGTAPDKLDMNAYKEGRELRVFINPTPYRGREDFYNFMLVGGNYDWRWRITEVITKSGMAVELRLRPNFIELFGGDDDDAGVSTDESGYENLDFPVPIGPGAVIAQGAAIYIEQFRGNPSRYFWNFENNIKTMLPFAIGGGMAIDTTVVRDEDDLGYGVITLSDDYPHNYIRFNKQDKFYKILMHDGIRGIVYIERSEETEKIWNMIYPMQFDATEYTLLEWQRWNNKNTFDIFSNFVKSPWYYFTTKPEPVLSPTVERINGVLRCRQLSTALNRFYSIKSYRWEFDDLLNSSSEDIASNWIDYYFREAEAGKTYKAKLTLTTQDNVTVTSKPVSITIPQGTIGIKNFSASRDIAKSCVKLTWENTADSDQYLIIRKDNKGCELSAVLTGKTGEYYDYKARNNYDYTYFLTPKNTAKNIIYKTEEASISVNFSYWTIYFVTAAPYERPPFVVPESAMRIYEDYMWGELNYKVESVWRTMFDVKESKVVHHIDKKAVVGYSGKPAISASDNDYISLSFTAPLLTSIDCETNPGGEAAGYNHDELSAWKSLISSKQTVMIKNSFGDLWFGELITHSYTIDESDALYQVDCTFTQTHDLKNILIKSDSSPANIL